MFCCGPRSHNEEPPIRGAPKPTRQAKKLSNGAKPLHATYGRLLVKVERGEKLLGMDRTLNVARMRIEKTSDLFVSVGINDDEPFGETKVAWQSSGNPRWDQCFTAWVPHPKSYLCVFVYDDSPLSGPIEAFDLKRKCGFIEIPLCELNINQPLTGWFTLNHPALADSNDTLADREETLSHHLNDDGNLPKAGRIKLTLSLQTTLPNELIALSRPEPVFEKSLPELNVPQVFGDVFEIKRLLLHRLVGAACGSVSHAISWSNPLLTAFVLCWHWFLYYQPRFIPATLWILFLLCFWHHVPQDNGEVDTGQSEEDASPNAEDDSGSDDAGMLRSIRSSAQLVVDGTKCIADTAANQARTVAAKTKAIVHAPGLQEFQHILQLKPQLRDTVRGMQPKIGKTKASLQKMDDLFYWGPSAKTRPVVAFGSAAAVVSIALCDYMGSISGRAWLIGGSLVIASKSPIFMACFRFVRGVVHVCTKSATPYAQHPWFEAIIS